MKIKIYILFITLLVSSFLQSCQNYLDVKPKSQVKEETLFSSERGFMDALTGLYTLMARRNLYGDKLTMSFLDVLAQRYRVDKATSPYWDAARYNYESDLSKLPVKSTIRDIWGNSYAVIANANNILEQIDDKKTLFLANNYSLVKGEALALRAFMHFDMLRLFGPVYNKAKEKAAIPYRIKVSRESQPLLSAEQVANLIIADLKAAEELLAKDPVLSAEENNYTEFNQPYRKYHMNLVAVQGLLARVYLYMGDKENAYTYALKTINQRTFSFVTGAEASAKGACRDRTYRFEHLFVLMINNMQPYTDEYFNDVPTTYENNVLSNDESVIDAVFEKQQGNSTDIRRTNLWESLEGKLVHAKFWQLKDNTPNCDFAKNLMPVLRISEVYYIAAETAPTQAQGVNYLNEIRAYRGLDPISAQISAAAYQLEIQKEYQKEFFSEGQLFYYYKRKNLTQIPGTTKVMDEKVYQLPLPVEETMFSK